jgi:predicted component of type VI protein secretion system
MALELRIAGPGLDVVRRLGEGDEELILGRDAECDVWLPDPQRNVSRRHLAVWVEANELHFHVLSVVNGVEMPFGEAPPGARGVLALGESLKVADYSLRVESLAGAAEPKPDPWAVFDREGSGAAPALAASEPAQDDPFGEWGFETTFGPNAPGGPLEAGSLGAGDLHALFRGLGLDPATLGALSEGELEGIGKLVRTVVLGLLQLHATALGVNHGLHAEDRTLVAPKDNNPLKSDWPDDTKLRYLFGGRAAGVGFMHPERAVHDLLAEISAHQVASGAASRAALESTLKDFAPATLKGRLLGTGSRLFEAARVWDAYQKYYDELARDMPSWVQHLMERYFVDAYLRESLRIKGETTARRR